MMQLNRWKKKLAHHNHVWPGPEISLMRAKFRYFKEKKRAPHPVNGKLTMDFIRFADRVRATTPRSLNNFLWQLGHVSRWRDVFFGRPDTCHVLTTIAYILNFVKSFHFAIFRQTASATENEAMKRET